MEWAAGPGADVVSMSLGGTEPSDGTDPMARPSTRSAHATGALFVIAAGNDGRGQRHRHARRRRRRR